MPGGIGIFNPKEPPEHNPFPGVPALPSSAESARVRTQTLTVELLDWLIAALEAVLSTPQLRDLARGRVELALRDAMKLIDHLYPYTEEVRRATSFPDVHPSLDDELARLPVRAVVDVGPRGSDAGLPG